MSDAMRSCVNLDKQGVSECNAMAEEECRKYGRGMDVCLGCPVDDANRARAAAALFEGEDEVASLRRALEEAREERDRAKAEGIKEGEDRYIERHGSCPHKQARMKAEAACANAVERARAAESRLAEATEIIRYFESIEGGGGCAPGVVGHDQPCGCDLTHALARARSFLDAQSAAPGEGAP